MNLFQKMIVRAIKYSGVSVRDPALADFFGGAVNTLSGAVVTPKTALALPTAFACIRVLAESVAQIPFPVYKRLSGGAKERDAGHALHILLSRRPNSWQTPFEFRETLVTHLNLRGNFYALKIEGNDGITRELIPLHPDRVTPFWVGDGFDAFPAYRYRPKKGAVVILLQSEIHHVRFFPGDDHLTGQTPIRIHRETIGAGLSMLEYNARFFGNDATPGGVLEVDGVLKDDQVKGFREHWEKAHKGTFNARKVAVLEAGMTYKQITVSPDDAQYIESRKMSNLDICRIFRVPPHMVADLERATFSNIEQQSLDFVTYSLMPWLTRIEQATHRDLFTEKQARTHFVKFLVDGLLRGDYKSRNEGYAVGRNGGWLSVNDIRRLEDMNPVSGGDTYLTPLNMAPVGSPLAVADPKAKTRLLALADGGARRALTREVRSLTRVVNRHGCDVDELKRQVADFYDGHADFLKSALAIDTDRAVDYCDDQADQLAAAIDTGLNADDLIAVIRTFETEGLPPLVSLAIEGTLDAEQTA